MQLQEFIDSHLGSVDHLRALLLLYSHPETEWDPAVLATKLYLRLEVAKAVLAELKAKGLSVAKGEPPRYHYEPRSPELSAMVEALAQMDRERPVTLLNMIYAHPKDIQAVADAFKLRKDKDR